MFPYVMTRRRSARRHRRLFPASAEGDRFQPPAKAIFPDIRSLIGKVHTQLDAQPVPLTIADDKGKENPVVIGRATMQSVVSGMIADPAGATILLYMYRDIAAGGTGMLNMVIPRFFTPGGPIRLNAMPTAMDVASGISEERLALVTEQSRSALLGMALNFPMLQLRGALQGHDLGDEFREETQSNVPTLLLAGTLDGRTYPEEQMEAVAGLDNLSRVTVENAGHNLFMVTPEVTAAIEAFLRGEKVPESIVLPLPDSLHRLPRADPS